uniref:sugar phosphate isomerase/epimerase family protein n=1 Tax=Pseudonocardia pini TaxID=2758030 RepID=UPI0015F1225F
TDDALAVLDAVPGLGLSLDASHLVVTTHDLADAVARLGARVTNVAVKDGSGTPEDFVFGVLGTGDVDFAALLAGLAEQGFTGPVTVEHESHQFGDTRPAAQVLTESLAYVRSVLPTPVPR